VGYQVLLYDKKYHKNPSKLQMHWFGPFYFAEVKYSGVVWLAQLDDTLFFGWVNGTRLKPYFFVSNLK